jgi:hypothetical protein
MVQIVSQELQHSDPEGFEYFWHGVGRAHYFLPIHFVPGYGSIWYAVRMIRQAAPNEQAWLNGIAGLGHNHGQHQRRRLLCRFTNISQTLPRQG